MHALSAHAWDYLPALQTVFESVGPDYLAKKGLMLLWVSSPQN